MTDVTDLDRSRATRLTTRRMATAIAAAIVLNLLVYGIGTVVGATWLANGQTIAWFLVIVATLVPMLVGTLLVWVLARRWASARSVMAWVGLVFGLITAPAPLLSSDNGATAFSLAAMHVVTGVVWFLAVRPRRASSAG